MIRLLRSKKIRFLWSKLASLPVRHLAFEFAHSWGFSRPTTTWGDLTIVDCSLQCSNWTCLCFWHANGQCPRMDFELFVGIWPVPASYWTDKPKPQHCDLALRMIVGHTWKKINILIDPKGCNQQKFHCFLACFPAMCWWCVHACGVDLRRVELYFSFGVIDKIKIIKGDGHGHPKGDACLDDWWWQVKIWPGRCGMFDLCPHHDATRLGGSSMS